MPAVFIHGVPDTYRVWDRVIGHLSPKHSMTALPLPGFGAPLPSGFTATKEEYVSWIIEQLEEQSAPVDLVGHDWGCALTVRVASLRPDLVRSWAGGSSAINSSYEWHPIAKIFQTPGEGEQWFANLDREHFSQEMAKQGVPLELAKQTVSHIDSRMADCILRLYRSAVDLGAEWQGGLSKISSPGLVFWGTADQACQVWLADPLAKDTGARRVLLMDAGHWCLEERPAELARALEEHWSQIS